MADRDPERDAGGGEDPPTLARARTSAPRPGRSASSPARRAASRRAPNTTDTISRPAASAARHRRSSRLRRARRPRRRSPARPRWRRQSTSGTCRGWSRCPGRPVSGRQTMLERQGGRPPRLLRRPPAPRRRAWPSTASMRRRSGRPMRRSRVRVVVVEVGLGDVHGQEVLGGRSLEVDGSTSRRGWRRRRRRRPPHRRRASKGGRSPRSGTA